MWTPCVLWVRVKPHALFFSQPLSGKYKKKIRRRWEEQMAYVLSDVRFPFLFLPPEYGFAVFSLLYWPQK